jgi:hypothetical protein
MTRIPKTKAIQLSDKALRSSLDHPFEVWVNSPFVGNIVQQLWQNYRHISAAAELVKSPDRCRTRAERVGLHCPRAA